MFQRFLTRALTVLSLAIMAALATFAGVYLHQVKLGSPTNTATAIPDGDSKGDTTAPADTSSLPPMGVWTDAPADIPNPQSPIVTAQGSADGISYMLIEGGVAGSRRSMRREGVADFVRQYDAAAGLNGTFFANASLEGTDNGLIGPSLCGDEPAITIGPYDQRPDLTDRPLVLMSPTHIKIVNYDPEVMDDDSSLRGELPDVSDLFLGGVWLVHNGAAADNERLLTYHVKDCNDPRRRAFFAIAADGRPALGATTCGSTSRQLARSLADYGIREAVLLDSGFSTSLVLGDKVLVTGHSLPGLASRPVPHSILLFANPQTANLPNAAPQPAG